MVCWHLTENNLSKSNVRRSVTFSISIFFKFSMENELFLQIIILSGWKLFGQNIHPRHNTSLGHPKSGNLHASETHPVAMPQKPTQWPCLRSTSSSEIHLVAMLQKSNQWPCLRNPLSGHASETLRNPTSGHVSETHWVAMPQKPIQ